MKDLNAMRILLQVAEQKSFSAAAEVLGVPRSSVSAAVAQLEEEMGTRLLMRTTRRVEVTRDGELFIARAHDLLAGLDDLKSLFCSDAQALEGVVRADMPVHLARDLVIPKLYEFQQRYPLIGIELSCTDRRVDPVAEGFDLVIRVGELHDSSLVCRRLGEHQMVNCASPAYLEHYGMPLTPEDLVRHKVVGYSQTLGRHAGDFDYVLPSGQQGTVAVPATISVNNADAYTAACLAGYGIIQSPRLGMMRLLSEGLLCEVLPDYPAPAMPVSMLFPQRRLIPQRVRVFMDWISELITDQLNTGGGAGAFAEH